MAFPNNPLETTMTCQGCSHFDVLSVILVLYAFGYLVHRLLSLVGYRQDITGVVSAKRQGFLNLIHRVTIETKNRRIEVAVSRNDVGLMSVGDRVNAIIKGGRLVAFDVVKSNFHGQIDEA